MKKSEQFYKVVNVVKGHNGYHYHIGINRDPLAAFYNLDEIGSCGAGAFYFVRAEHLSEWKDIGTHIAWITPKSKIRSDDNKFKAQVVEVTQILPFEEALPLIKEIPLTDWVYFDVPISKKMILEDKDLDNVEKFEMLAEDFPEDLYKFVIAHKTDKNLLKHVPFSSIEWEPKEIRGFIKNGLSCLIGEEELSLIAENKDWKLLYDVIMSDPQKYSKLLVNVI